MNPADRFLLTCIRSGLAHSFDTKSKAWVKPYPEVTGYLLSYFSKRGVEPPELTEAANKLMRLQSDEGGFASFFSTDFLYTFDTAQIAHGLVSYYKCTRDARALDSAIRAGDFLLFMQTPDGSFFPMYNRNTKSKYVEQADAQGTNWGSTFSYIQVKNAEALLLLYQITKEKRFHLASRLLEKWALKNFDTRFTHPFGYYLEGMMALGHREFVKKLLTNEIKKRERAGYIPYFPEAGFAYVSGSVQWGILCASVDLKPAAKRIFAWASKVQSMHDSGGLYQYANADGTPNDSIHTEINSWGTKYYSELRSLL